MKKQEKELFKKLCSYKSNELDEGLLEYAVPSVLGQLFFNRMQAIAYYRLKKHDMLGKVNREFRNSLEAAYEQNVSKNKSFFWCIQYLTEALSECSCKYAMLKGAFLCGYYPTGLRTSNDIDLLVLPEDVTKIGEALMKNGFAQGHIRSGEFVPAARKEIIESKMTRGEAVPYIKKINLPGMRYLEVDINFSLDYKNNKPDVIQKILDRAEVRNISGISVQTLESADFFIHLCGHLYKEATTLPWIEMKRDMTLYKYCDIYTLLSEMTDCETDRLFERADELGMKKICAFAILQTSELFETSCDYAVLKSENALGNDLDFLNRIISPKDKKEFAYTEYDVFERSFSENRRSLLKEVIKPANECTDVEGDDF